VVLAGDLNSNAEPGPESTGTAQHIGERVLSMPGSSPTLRSGYTWPLFVRIKTADP